MLTFWVIVFYIIIERIYSQQTVSPTNQDAMNEYYDTIDLRNTFAYKNIICGKPNCHIICDIVGGCFDVSIDASISEILTIICNTNIACGQLTIIKPPSISFEMICTEILNHVKMQS